MQRNAGNVRSRIAHAVENLPGEMQPGRGRGDGAAFARKDRLITLAVFAAIFPFDIGRQRHVAKPVDSCVYIFVAEESNCALTAFAVSNNLSRETVVKTNDFADV